MQALYRFRSFPARAFLIGMALTALALLSATGGYAIRALTATASQVVTRAAIPSTVAPGAIEGDRWYLDQQAPSESLAPLGDRWYLDTPAPVSVHEDNGR